ncbi:MAG: cold-shock protein [Flavobacteriaceae bacterium]|jgi:CspA family cold shock protein|nr:cold-shock protein [Flavobacteriaceae bacterium]MAR43846.1 cold-shock protein [Flavobacteriaceae bacterium]MAW09420.1 cold-shock protein [Flavobacteriaceae bacterium]OUW66011.1 MAG: cold-shock protein [Flavobacteriaceae bacterium TMED200]|tara:strand:- start:175 stop:366 length:192 start_codon:yes stop_codon:yes gene_type:complete
MQGKVKFFNSSKGYGFIVDDETGDDVFVHVTSLNGLKINEGDKVEYVIEEGERGKTATNIQLV